MTQPEIISKAEKYGVTLIQVEVNKSTEGFVDGLTEQMKNKGYRCTIKTKNSSSQTSKWARIFDKAPDIREHFVFLDMSHRSRDYTKFLENVFSYKINISDRALKRQHDDAPDSLAQAAELLTVKKQTIQIFQRPW